MKLLKNTLVIALTVATLKVSAQSKELTAAFNQSYEFEAALKYDAAIKAVNAVYSATSYETNLRLGWLNYAAGKNREALPYYQKAAEIMPASTEPLWAIINPMSKLNDWVDIEKVYLNILKLDPKNASACYNLGLIYYYRKDYVSAKKYFDVSLNLSPFNYSNMLMSGWVNYFLGNKKEATALFNKTLLYSPNDKSALEGLSLIK